jgi:hypothetical protein
MVKMCAVLMVDMAAHLVVVADHLITSAVVAVAH